MLYEHAVLVPTSPCCTRLEFFRKMSDPAKIKTRCPHCDSTFSVSSHHVGKVAKCPASGCGEKFKVEAIGERESAPPPSKPTPAERPNPYLDSSKHDKELDPRLTAFLEEYSDPTPAPIQHHGTASNPGGVRVKPLRWLLNFYIWLPFGWFWPTVFAVLIVAGAWFAIVSLPDMGEDIHYSALGMLVVMAGVFLSGVYWQPVWQTLKAIRVHYEMGDANPGIVVSLHPLLIAVRTDLRLAGGHYPAVKIEETRLSLANGEMLAIGTIVATIATYAQPIDESMPHWSDFYPLPVDWVANAKTVDRVMATFSGDQIRSLQEALQHVPQPFEPGLYLLWTGPGKAAGRKAEWLNAEPDENS